MKRIVRPSRLSVSSPVASAMAGKARSSVRGALAQAKMEPIAARCSQAAAPVYQLQPPRPT
jgi:hypothetical protein